MRGIERVNGSPTKHFVVAGDVVIGRQSEVVEDVVTVKRVGIDPELIPEANTSHIRTRRMQRRSNLLRRIAVEGLGRSRGEERGIHGNESLRRETRN